MNPRICCAVYTRKSSEEGLEQSFNSLDAQREACEAYIASQKHEGWHLISTHYDDGGFSGGNMERPALKQLMDDIRTGKVQTIVVYKVDRLTRSLADFAKLVEQFDKMNVSFVSVTQQFNTTTSMGRLTLNVLLSFAQFEREVTGERIRDKIAASKKKGMWMGGTVPIGYDVRERKLYINEADAETVRSIFKEFLRLGTVSKLHEWLRKNDIRSRGGNQFFRGALYMMLRNPHYIGLIRHKEETYPGEHLAIINQSTWDKVQALLTENRQGKHSRPRSTKVSLLTGILFDADGTRYTSTHASKNGRRYRYYTSQTVIKKMEKREIPTRIPAPELEKAVIERIVSLLKDANSLLSAIRDNTIGQQSSIPNGLLAKLFAQSAAFASNWETRLAADRAIFLNAILERVLIHTSHVEIRIRVNALIEQLLGRNSTAEKSIRETASFLHQIAVIECSYRHAPHDRALRLIIGSSQPASNTSRQAIQKALARARVWYEQIVTGQATSIANVAQLNSVNKAYVNRILPLAFLSPKRVESLLSTDGGDSATLDDLLQTVSMRWVV